MASHNFYLAISARNAAGMVFLPTVEEAVCFAAYHMSQKHMPATMETMVIGFEPQATNLAYNVGQKKVNHFQRGQSVQFLQVLSPCRYKLSNMEKDNLRVMSLDYNPADKFVTYSWNNGWVWFYGHAVHLQTMLQEQLKDEQYIHTTLMTQCLQHLGQYGTTMLAPDCQTMINSFRATMAYVAREPEEQRGHPNHKE